MTTNTMPAKASTAGPRLKTALPGPNAKRILAGDEKYISPSYTRSYPLVAKRGRGLVVDLAGVERVAGPSGVQPIRLALAAANCPEPPELLARW